MISPETAPIGCAPALINCAQLAAHLGKPHTFVTAMRRAGYQLEYEAAGRTTLSHALAALKRAPEFVAHHYLATKGWERLPKLLSEPANQTASTCGKSR